MSDEMEGLDLSILRHHPRRASQTLEGRKKAERKRMAKADRYEMQKTGRTQQMNHRHKQETIDIVERWAAFDGCKPCVIVEKAVQEYHRRRSVEHANGRHRG